MKGVVLKALEAIIKAHDDMFGQCASNPIYNAWGSEISVRKLNDAKRLADDALAALSRLAEPGEDARGRSDQKAQLCVDEIFRNVHHHDDAGAIAALERYAAAREAKAREEVEIQTRQAIAGSDAIHAEQRRRFAEEMAAARKEVDYRVAKAREEEREALNRLFSEAMQKTAEEIKALTDAAIKGAPDA